MERVAETLVPVAGEPFKLRAADTRNRSQWINRLRVVSQDHAERNRLTASTQAAVAAIQL